jgi:hypothetical protein
LKQGLIQRRAGCIEARCLQQRIRLQIRSETKLKRRRQALLLPTCSKTIQACAWFALLMPNHLPTAFRGNGPALMHPLLGESLQRYQLLFRLIR